MTNRTILIVEDEPRIAHWLKIRFERAGFSAEVAGDGRTGLALARSRRPHLIVLDLMLPRLDGMQVCRILRRESAVPIIMLTARESHADRIVGLDSGADDYIVKPFDPDEVVARAKAVLRRVDDKVQPVLTCGTIRIDETTRQVTVGDRPISLSRAQFALLAAFMRHPVKCSPRPTHQSGIRRRLRGVRASDRQPHPSSSQANRPSGKAADPDSVRRRLPFAPGAFVSERATSLHRRILRAFVLIVLLAVVLGVGVGYYVTQGQMTGFVEQLIVIQAGNLARSLSRAYSASGGWAMVDRVLADAGYRYDEGEEEHEGRGEREERGSETFHVERVRIVVVGGDGMVVRDNLSRLRPGSPAPKLGGERVAVIDVETGRPVGEVYVDADRAFLATEAHGFLRRMLATTAFGGVLIAAVALALAAWLSGRITAPVTRLTAAARAVARQDESGLLPVTSADELGQMSAAFNRMTTALQTQRDLRRRLITDLSHELNTPLSVIQLEAKGLLDGLQDPSQAANRIIRK